MGRGPKPTKSKEAKPSVARRSSKNDAPRVRDLKKRLAEALRDKAASQEQLQTRDRELVEAQEQQTATGEILRVISRTPTDAQPVFETIARNALRLCDGRFSAVFRYDGRLIYPVALQNFTAVALEHAGRVYPTPIDGPGPVAAAVREARLQHILDAENDPRPTPETIQIPRSLGARSNVIVPMIRGGEAIGAIAVGRTAVGGFTDAQIELLKTFADQAVIAIENVRLVSELEETTRSVTDADSEVGESLEQQTATSETLRVIAESPTEIQPVLDAVVSSVARLLEVDHVQLFLVRGDVLELTALHGEFGSVPPRPILRSLPIGRAVIDRQPVHVADLQSEMDEFPHALGSRVRTALAMPLLREGLSIGVIQVIRREVRLLSDKQIALLKIFADQAVIAIENVRLFTELQEKNSALTSAHAQVSEALEQQTATAEILRV